MSMQFAKGKNGRADDTSVKNGKPVDAKPIDAKPIDAKNGKPIPPFDKVYRPSEREPFMNERQREYFRLKLLDWREDILKEAKETLQHLQDDNQNHPDLADRASSETDRAIELRARDRQRKLIAKIDAALQRIEDGTYGYCEIGSPHRHAVDRSAGAPRAPRAGVSGRVGQQRAARMANFLAAPFTSSPPGLTRWSMLTRNK